MEILIKNLSFSYNKKDLVLRNINYCFGKECYVLSGPNASGKTTFSKLLCGLLKVPKNKVFLNGMDIVKKPIATISKMIGYLYQNPDLHFFCENVQDELAFPFIINGSYNDAAQKIVARIMTAFRLGHLQEKFPLLLSVGEKQRLALATVFIRDIQFLILDEPTSALDMQGKKFLADIINKFINAGGGALLISHDQMFVNKLENAKKLVLENGGIYET